MIIPRTLILSASLALCPLLASAQTIDHPSVAPMVTAINAERARFSLPPLAEDPRLDALAEAHSMDMVRSRFFSHDSPSTGRPSDRVSQSGLRWSAVAENIAINQSPEAAQQALLRSPGHHENMVDPAQRSVGVGIVRHGDQVWVTQLFATLNDAPGATPSTPAQIAAHPVAPVAPVAPAAPAAPAAPVASEDADEDSTKGRRRGAGVRRPGSVAPAAPVAPTAPTAPSLPGFSGLPDAGHPRPGAVSHRARPHPPADAAERWTRRARPSGLHGADALRSGARGGPLLGRRAHRRRAERSHPSPLGPSRSRPARSSPARDPALPRPGRRGRHPRRLITLPAAPRAAVLPHLGTALWSQPRDHPTRLPCRRRPPCAGHCRRGLRRPAPRAPPRTPTRHPPSRRRRLLDAVDSRRRQRRSPLRPGDPLDPGDPSRRPLGRRALGGLRLARLRHPRRLG
ncbi:MAG: CAP domain-containing protein [Deltaproteobacteria bacterium]|nr:CAP domain-containing protein [Deltaproteobacteria bacterium]